MALQTQTVPVVFGQGLDEKSDPSSIIPGKWEVLENVVFKKKGVLQKRNGYKQLPSVPGGCTALTSLGDELIAFNGTRMYSYAPNTMEWLDRGAAVVVTSSQAQVIRNSYQQSNSDLAVNGDVRCVAWEDSRGGLRYSVQDVSTGAFYVSDAVVDAAGVGPKVVSFGNYILIFYASGSNLKYRRMSIVTPSSLDVALVFSGSLDPNAQAYDVATIGSRVFVAWNDTGIPDVQLSYLDASYGIASSVSTVATSLATVSVTGDVGQNVWVAGSDGITLRGRVMTYGLVARSPAFVIEGSVTASHVVTSIAGTVGTFIYETNIAGTLRTNTYDWSTGTVGTASVFMRGVGLYSKIATIGASRYLWATFNSPFQSTYFLVDISNAAIVNKACPTIGGGARTGLTLAEIVPIGATALEFAAGQKGKLEVETGKAFSTLGVVAHRSAFTSAFSAAVLRNNLLIAGGAPQSYDGLALTEAGFHVYPETLTSSTGGTFTITITTDGDGTHKETTQIVFPAGNRIAPGQYFTLHSANDARAYYVWVTVDGVGIDPAPGGIPIQVAALSSDTSAQVATKAAAAIGAFVVDFTASSAFSTVTVTNQVNGATTNAANAVAPLGILTGSVGAGTYLYYAIYEWTDNFGQSVRSAPSTPLSVTLGGIGSVSVIVPTLRLSSKTNVRVSVYRTVAGGVVPIRVTSIVHPTPNIPTQDTVTFVDTHADADLSVGEVLYAYPNILVRVAPQPCNAVASYRDRMFLCGLPDSNQIQGSTITPPGESVSFADEVVLNVDARGGPVTALGALDDKLVIFKASEIYVLVGNGPNNTGQGSDWGTPTLVTTDTGCANPRSIVQTPAGLMFQSPKGVYLLDRSLSVQYIGAEVENTASATVAGATLVPNTNQIRFVTSADGAPVYDYLFGQWATFTNHAAVGCTVWNGEFSFAKSDGRVFVEAEGTFVDGSDPVRIRAVSGDMAFAGIQGFQRVRKMLILGHYKGPHQLRLRLAFDGSAAYKQEQIIDATSLVGGSFFGSDPLFGSGTPFGGEFRPYQFELAVGAGLQKCRSIRVAVEDVQSSSYNEGCSLVAFALEVGAKAGATKIPAVRSF